MTPIDALIPRLKHIGVAVKAFVNHSLAVLVRGVPVVDLTLLLIEGDARVFRASARVVDRTSFVVRDRHGRKWAFVVFYQIVH